jgi:hypothetical protein
VTECHYTRTGRAVTGIDATCLRAGLAKRSQSASDLLVRVAGAVLGPALGPAVLHPASVFFDFRRYSKLWEPGTRGLDSRPQLGSAQVQWLQTRFLAKKEVA